MADIASVDSSSRTPLNRQLWPVTYCVVPADLGRETFMVVRRHLRRSAGIRVVMERRVEDRRAGSERRGEGACQQGTERRKVHSSAGRRVGDRRTQVLVVEPVPLPAAVRKHASRLVFMERLEPSGAAREDAHTDRLVLRFQAGDHDAFVALYTRYFDRLYRYLLVVLGSDHAAEDAAQEVFARVLRALPRYERRSVPWRAWLFRIARNHALDQLRISGRLELTAEFDDVEAETGQEEASIEDTVGWLPDRDLAMLVERLPLAQRQALVLRFTLDLTSREVAAVMGRSTTDVRALQSRALRYLRERLDAMRAETKVAKQELDLVGDDRLVPGPVVDVEVADARIGA